VLKFNYNAFTQVVILGSSTFTPFMQLKAADRREIIEDLLDIQIFSCMNTILKERVGTLKSSIQETERHIELLNEKIKMHKDHLEKIKGKTKERLDDIRDRIQENQDAIEVDMASSGSIQEQMDKLQSDITDKTKTEQTVARFRKVYNSLQNNLKRLKNTQSFFDDNDTCPSCDQEIDDDVKQKKKIEHDEKENKINETTEELNKQIKLVDDRQTVIAETQEKILDLSVVMQEKQNSVAAMQKYIASMQEEITSSENSSEEVAEPDDSLDNQLKQMSSEQEGQGKLNQLYDVSHAMLKDSGIKTKIIQKYLPIMNKLINKYLADMDFFVNFTLDDQFNETIKSRFRDEFSYFSFSEGEKFRLDIALLFAWREIARQNNSMSTNLLIMDEVFDSSLDPSGTDDFLKLIQGLSEGTNCFIISHKADSLMDKFPNVLEFQKVKGFTRMIAS